MNIKTVLYVTTQITGTWRYFSWCSYPNIWYYRIQREVLSYLNSSLHLSSSVKFYPNDLFSNPNIKSIESEFNNVNILKDSLLEILKNNDFDLIITEACATTLLEILCSKSQVICFIPSDYVKFTEEGLMKLSKRAHLSDSKFHYLNKIKYSLSENSILIKKELNDEFLFNFGLGCLSNRPGYIEKEYIEKIIGEKWKEKSFNI